ncbi:hypothetical protein [Devriesea agamarum]|uniref:hypothetical protein n=1 Tax=Devriesea agamarum TaxID=472569 RepID=UPI00071CEDDB|nr:hypothetical protein [Devriesea agamarum]
METVTIIRHAGTTKNARGQLIDTWGPQVAVTGVGVDIPDTSEPRDGITLNVRYDYRLYFPPGTTISARDKLIVRGHECAVEEPGEPLVNMFTVRPFRTEVLARRVSE